MSGISNIGDYWTSLSRNFSFQHQAVFSTFQLQDFDLELRRLGVIIRVLPHNADYLAVPLVVKTLAADKRNISAVGFVMSVRKLCSHQLSPEAS